MSVVVNLGVEVMTGSHISDIVASQVVSLLPFFPPIFQVQLLSH